MKLSAFFSREQLAMSIREILSRFFQAALVSLILTTYIVHKIIRDNSNEVGQDDIFARTVTSLILTFFLSLGISIFYESSEKKYIDREFPILPIVYGLVFYFTVKFGQNYSLQSFTYFTLHLTGFIAFAFFLPYIRRVFQLRETERDTVNIEYSNYFSRVSWTFLMSGIVGLSLVILGAIAILSVVSLFELGPIIDEEKYYGTWITFSLAFIAPMYGLREFPRLRDIEKKEFEINHFFSFLIRYIATPAVYIYFIILYAYSIKVLMNFSDWPRGIVSWLVIGFSSFGYLTYIFSKPYEENKMVLYFRKHFPLVVIPQLLMLFYAIGLRIHQYDLTMNRYFVVAFGSWLFVTSFYFIFRRSPLLAFIPASLAMVSFLISIGPWGVFSYPFARQEAKLLRNLEAAKILQNGKIVPLASERDISKELSTDIASEIDYLCRFDNCKRIKEIFPDQVVKIEKKSKEDWEKWNYTPGKTYPGASYYEIQNGIANEIKVSRYAFDDDKRTFPEQEYLTYYTNYQSSQYPLSVKGYDMIVQVLNSSDMKYQKSENIQYPYITLNPNTKTASYVTSSGISMDFALSIPEKLLDSSTFTSIPASDLIFDIKNERLEIRLMLQSLTLKNPRYIPGVNQTNLDIPIDIGGGYGLALIKNKK